MQKNRSRDILFYIETEAQFESIEKLLTHINSNTNITFDVVVPSDVLDDPTNNRVIYDKTAKKISSKGFIVRRGLGDDRVSNEVANTDYRVLLSAYMYSWHYKNIHARYRLMFPYASYYFNKPNWTVRRFIEQDYVADALLSHAVGTKDVTDVFTRTYIVPSLKLIDYKKSVRSGSKPVLFFAPTYGEMDFALKILDQIDSIKKKYTVIMRGHHRESQIGARKSALERLYDKADKIYDADKYPITTPLGVSDILISDNSAVIFDAIYCGIPVAIFSKEPNTFHYKDINTAQSELINSSDVMWTDDPKKILKITDTTLTPKMLNKQKVVRKKLFPSDWVDPVSSWMDVLSLYIEDKLPAEYYPAKKYWVDSIRSRVEENEALRAELDILKHQIEDRDSVIRNEQAPGIKTSVKRLGGALLRRFYIIPKKRIKYLLRPIYRKIRIVMFNDPVVIYQFVFTEPHGINFGDELTKDILERLFKRKVEVHNEIDSRFDMLGVGSLIHFFNNVVDYRIYVWGSGLIDDDVQSINENFIFRACRGKKTRDRLSSRYQNITLGDPGLLANLIYKNKVEKTDRIGVIPHFRDEKSFYLNNVIKNHPEIFKIIPVNQAPEEVADQIKSCRLVLSSSLHGLIVSDSFGVPNIHLKLSDNLQSPNHLRGGEHKFRDYYSGIGKKYINFDPRKKDLLNMREYKKLIEEYRPIENMQRIQKDLMKSFPY